MPLIAIDRLANLGQRKVAFELCHSSQISKEVIGGNFERRIIAPLIWVADLGAEFSKLCNRLGLCLLAHPLKATDALAIGLNQVGNQTFHARLGSRWEVTFYVDLADCLSQTSLNECNSALPALA